jgi:glycosyltransferase involved in cell wall biosynthesis
MRLLGGQSDAVIVTNVADARVWPGHARVVPIGSNISPCLPPGFARDEWRAHYGADAGTLLIAFFGFLNASKGVDTLVEALATLVAAGRPARLLLVGEPLGASDPRIAPSRPLGRALPRWAADKVRATGNCPPPVSAALAAADLVALPL